VPGSRLDADHPENGVLIPCRNNTPTGLPKDPTHFGSFMVMERPVSGKVFPEKGNFFPGDIVLHKPTGVQLARDGDTL
jgi:hypothetical protein